MKEGESSSRESDCEPRDWNAVSCPEGFRCTLSSSPSSIVVRVEKDVASSRLVLLSTEHMASLDCFFPPLPTFFPFQFVFSKFERLLTVVA